MRLAFALYKYFPFGGLARDFMRIADVCLAKGHTIDVFVMQWEGPAQANYQVHVIDCKGWSNHAKVADFHRQLADRVQNERYDALIGFNKMPNLDVYYAADPCYADRFKNKGFAHQLNPRYRFYAATEASVFGTEAKTLCLMISDTQMGLFQQHYHTPEHRLLLLPPGIDPDRRKPNDAAEKRAAFRQAHGLTEEDQLILMVGTGFKTKGVDRGMLALASLPQELLAKTHLMVLGEDNLSAYKRQAKKLGVAKHCHFMGGRSDVPDFLLGADLLLHPARKENTGTVILEAMVAGLPMLVTAICGYAKHVTQSMAGRVIASPFQQQHLNKSLAEMLLHDKKTWSEHALAYASSEDLYSMPEKAAEAIERVAREKNHAV